MSVAQSPFPAGFLWGAATAAHQVEGGNRSNDWWDFEESGRLPHRSGSACEHFERFESDFDLAASMGHNCHRLSLEWSRIEPTEGRWDPAALRHYALVIEALHARQIEPVVTLFHFTVPAWLAARGGWAHGGAVERFKRFVRYVVGNLDVGVRYWLTINEPTVYVQQAYLNGEWPPMKTRAWILAGKALCNLARAHRLAYDTIRSRSSEARVSFAHSALWMEPCNPRRWTDRLASRCRDIVWNRLFFCLIGANPRAVAAGTARLDFIGLNYYTRCCVRLSGYAPAAWLGTACHLAHHEHSGPRSDIGWEVYPRGLGYVLERFAGLALPMLITENGIATVDDDLRCRFIVDHLAEIAAAVRRGLIVIGYLHWSLLDNFEWRQGTSARFGLAAVDFDTQQRSPRPSAQLFAELSRSNGVRFA